MRNRLLASRCRFPCGIEGRYEALDAISGIKVRQYKSSVNVVRRQSHFHASAAVGAAGDVDGRTVEHRDQPTSDPWSSLKLRRENFRRARPTQLLMKR